jgi:hypothetical protein
MGEEVLAGDTLYYYGWDAWHSVDFFGFVADVRYEDATYPPTEDGDEDEEDIAYQRVTIDLLAYSGLSVLTQVDVATLSQITYETSVKVIYDEKEYSAEVTTIGYEAQAGKVAVQVSLPLRLLPGVDVKVSFELDTVDHGMFLPEEYVFSLGDKSFVLLEVTGGGTQQTEVTLGQAFDMDGGNGHEYPYVEVITGVKEGDVVLLETVSDNRGAAIAERYGSQ